MGKTNYGVTGKLKGIKDEPVLKGKVGRKIRESLDNIKGSRKNRRIRRQDKKNPARALARIIDDEYEASDPSDYDQIHIGGRIYGKGTDSKKKYKPQKPRNVGPKVYTKGSGTRKVND